MHQPTAKLDCFLSKAEMGSAACVGSLPRNALKKSDNAKEGLPGGGKKNKG